MKKRKHWTNVLNKDDKKHLKEDAGCNLVSKEKFVRQFKWQQENGVDCFGCRQVARKLGLLEA